MTSANYAEFIREKSQMGGQSGFEPIEIPDFLFDFQKYAVDWALRKGKAAITADCGLGKTPMQLVCADNIHRKTNKPVLILTPLAVAPQTVREANKFGLTAAISTGEVKPGINVTNYEKLHHFKPEDFGGVVCDESSILKSFSGATQKRVTRFMAKIPYRLLCTATAAPNDYIELGTSSEALGELSYSDMLRRFFQMLDDKGQKKEQSQQDQAERISAVDPNYFKKLAYRVSQTIGQWRLKHHAVQHFWRWVASWCLAFRMPSDIGFSNDGFVLPELREHDHIIAARSLPPGFLFNMPAVGMRDERKERKRTLTERVEFVANLVAHDRPAVIWCHSNEEGDVLEKVIKDSRQIAGKTPDEKKIELYEEFAAERLRVLIIKPKIGAWGLNWQHCNHVVTFASHSYEQYYQSVRRCWRFGQKRPVDLDVVATEGELRVLGNMRRKGAKADAMFASLTAETANAKRVERENIYTKKVEAPSWLHTCKS